MDWHNFTSQRTLEEMGVNAQLGLEQKEAQVRLKRHGRNALKQKREAPLIIRFFAQFKDFMVIILLFAAGLSYIAGRLHGEQRLTDALIILGIVTLNAILGLVQESRAKRAMEALKEISQPEAKVLRNGIIITVSVEEIVVGDIVYLETGDIVPADLRLVSAVNLQSEESALTGESLPVHKDANVLAAVGAPLGDRVNMAFSGSFITYGRGAGVVVATGMDTQMGKIASMIMQEKSPDTPLQKKLAHLGKVLGVIALLICTAIFVIGIFRQIPPLDMFVTSVSLAVAAIPEGLVAIVTIMLAIGVTRMARRNAIIRKLPAVETLGSATVICSDKTGTLTQNKMKIVEISDGFSLLKRDGKSAQEILCLGCLCNDSIISEGRIIGDPTEAAFVEALSSCGIDKSQLEREKQRVAEIPFDSARKLMTTIHKNGEEFIAVTKGAPDVLLGRCTHIKENGRVVPLADKKRKAILSQVAKMADKALRVLAVANKAIRNIPNENDVTNVENGLIFVGLAGMIDPPRPEVREAVALCKQAGIRPVMITGDHAATALAIGRTIGITGNMAITGEQLAKMTNDDLANAIEQTNIFARVSPEDKLRIVRAFQAKGHTVAMTGDGVNDAPALKAADIGCAMGINGTAVAKAASDIVLTDDNFATIVAAVREGRGILTNIRKAVHFLLSSNIGEIITIFAAILLGWPVPLLAIHLLWVNLVTDSLPAIALGLDPAADDIMDGKATRYRHGMFGRRLWQRIFIEGAMIGMLSLLAFAIGYTLLPSSDPAALGRTMAFTTLSLSQLVHAFNMRSENSIFKIRIFKNRYLVGALIIGTFLQVSVISIPQVASIFHVMPLASEQWMIVAGLSLLPIVIVEIEKFLLQKFAR